MMQQYPGQGYPQGYFNGGRSNANAGAMGGAYGGGQAGTGGGTSTAADPNAYGAMMGNPYAGQTGGGGSQFTDQAGQSVGAQIMAATAQRAASGGPFDEQWSTGVWQQAGLDPQQALAAHNYARTWQQQTGKQMGESDLNDMIGQFKSGGAPNAAGWRSQGGGQPAQQQPYQPQIQPYQPAVGYPQAPGYPGQGGMTNQWQQGGQTQQGGNAMQYGNQPGRMTTQVQNTTPGMSYGGQAQQPSVQRPQVPMAHQVNPMVWDSLGPVGQELARGAIAQTGQDVGQYEYDMNRARPQGYAGQQPQARYRPTQQSGYSSGF